ncbi:glutathione S-transferase [Vibrio wakamikoensis]|uniref:Glutathione S-transferase n=2 Tax=Vibrionaceae TaxID=641 RepID=A0AAU8BNW2_9VIBR
MESMPILYSLHNCPFAIRARMALIKAQQRVRIRSIKLDNKPTELLQASPKASVPVLVVSENQQSLLADETHVLEQSLDIMVWALSKNDPHGLLGEDSHNQLPIMLTLIEEFERDFDPALNAFGCAKRYHENSMNPLRQECERELAKLELRLSEHPFLFGERESLVDIALLPFIRKFARIDKQWFREAPYPKVRDWLTRYLNSPFFSKVMAKQPLWSVEQADVYFGDYQFKR